MVIERDIRNTVIGTCVFRGVCGVVQCGFGPFLALHFAVRFSQNHKYTTSHFCGYICGVVYSLDKTIAAPRLIFAVTCVVWCI